MKLSDEELDRALTRLPTYEASNAERTLARARALFVEGPPKGLDRWLLLFERLFGRLEPALVVAVAVVDLGWAISNL
ncbi:MAG: hypothetical protein U1E65_09780 [Myxococcota bacterium]